MGKVKLNWVGLIYKSNPGFYQNFRFFFEFAPLLLPNMGEFWKEHSNVSLLKACV